VVVLKATTKTFTWSLGHTSTTKLEAPKNATEAETPERQDYQTTTKPRVSKEQKQNFVQVGTYTRPLQLLIQNILTHFSLVF
jgi:hypothetical protein